MFASQSFAPAVEAQPIPSESVSFQTEQRRTHYVGTGQSELATSVSMWSMVSRTLPMAGTS